MRLRAAALLFVPSALALVAQAQDAAPPAAGPAAPPVAPPAVPPNAPQDPAPPAQRPPVQDPAGLAALRRLAELSPTPGAAGVREVRCMGQASGLPVPLRLHVRWAGADGPKARVVDLPRELIAAEKSAGVESSLRALALGAFLWRAAWDPPTVAEHDVASARRGDDLVVTLRRGDRASPVVLTIGADGLPRSAAPADRGAEEIALHFERRGSVFALSGFTAGDPAAPASDASIRYFDAPLRFPMPRGIEWRRARGRTDDVVLHDVVVDGDLVPGTSEAESRAGRPRRLDDAARRAFERFDRAVATPYGAGVRSMACRVAFEAPDVRYRARVIWGPEGVTSVRMEPPADGDPPATPALLAGHRLGLAASSAGFLRPASDEFSGYDAAADAPASGAARALVLTPLATGGALARVRLEFDEGGRLAARRLSFRDGRADATFTRTWTEIAGKSVCTGETEAGVGPIASWTWHAPPGHTPLLHTLERTLRDGDATRTTRLTFTDWIVGGRPVAGTGGGGLKPDATAPAPDADGK